MTSSASAVDDDNSTVPTTGTKAAAAAAAALAMDTRLSSSRTLLHGVVDVVESCMGHPSSSVVRQHAGQIFLLIYNNLPPCSPSPTEEQSRQDDPSKAATSTAAATSAAAAVSRHSLTYTILLPTLATLAEPHENGHQQDQERCTDKGSDNWQKQEVCLLVAENVSLPNLA